MTRNLLVVIAGLLAAILVAIIVLRPQSRLVSPPTQTAAPSAAAPSATAQAPVAPAVPVTTPATPGAAGVQAAGVQAGGGLAKDSSDQSFVQFIANFRTSSLKSCTDSLTAVLKTSNPAALRRVSTVCSCATDHVVNTITVEEARAATVSAFAGDLATNPTIKSFKTRFVDSGKTCMTDSLRQTIH